MVPVDRRACAQTSGCHDSEPAELELASDTGSAGTPAASTGGATATRTAYAGDAERCVSLGPFADLTRAARAASTLRQRGFDPSQRAEEGETWEGYWVYVGGLESAQDEDRVLKNLERAWHQRRARDAATRGWPKNLRRPVQRTRRRRSACARREDSASNRKSPSARKRVTVYWIDLHLGASDRAVPTDGLLSAEEGNSRIEARICPATPAAPATRLLSRLDPDLGTFRLRRPPPMSADRRQASPARGRARPRFRAASRRNPRSSRSRECRRAFRPSAPDTVDPRSVPGGPDRTGTARAAGSRRGGIREVFHR